MASATTTFQPWYIDYHRTMAAAGTLGDALRRSASLLDLAKNLWSVDRKFKELLLHLDEITAIPPDDLAGLVSDLARLRSTVNSLLDIAFKRGYGNRRLAGGSMHSIRERNELLTDFIERCELGLSKELGSALECAAAEFTRGETVNVDWVISRKTHGAIPSPS